jgi:hypothetical protein
MQRKPLARQDSLFVTTPQVPDTGKRRLLRAIDELLDLSAARAAAEPFFSPISPATPYPQALTPVANAGPRLDLLPALWRVY